MEIVVSDLQDYHKSVIVRLDYLPSIFANEGDSLDN